MQNADQSTDLDRRRKVAARKSKLQLSDSPAFRMANRKALASIKKTVARLRADRERLGSDSAGPLGPEGNRLAEEISLPTRSGPISS